MREAASSRTSLVGINSYQMGTTYGSQDSSLITTLSGMLVFRGLSNVVLGGKPLPIKSETFVRLFGGGANCYVSDFLGGGEGLNRVALAVGIPGSVIYIIVTICGHLNRKKKGYETGNVAAMYTKMVVICVVIMAISFKLAQHKGIPISLVWVRTRTCRR